MRQDNEAYRPRWVSLMLVLLLSACAFGTTPTPRPTEPLPPGPTPATRATPLPTLGAMPAATSPARVSPAATRPVAAATPAPTRPAPTPRGQQVLTLAGGIEPPRTLDPALVRDSTGSFLTRQVFSGLLKLDERLEVVPDLVTSLPTVSPDRRVYSFVLRDDAIFHDGTPVTAQSVKDAFERAGDPGLAGGDGTQLPANTYLGDIRGMDARLRGERGDVEGIRVTGPRTLDIELVAPQSTFLVKLTHSTTSIVDARQVRGRDWWKRPNGSGPFRLTEWRDGERLVFSRWDRYYEGPPPLERIVWLMGANASQPLNLYEAGKIDATGLGADSIDRALTPGSALNADLRVTPQLSLSYIAFNVKEPPFDDVKVRQAFAMIVERDKIVRVMFEGKAREAVGLVPPPLPASDLTRPTPDRAAVVAEARRLLAESRYGANPPRPRFFMAGGGMGGMLRDVIERDLGITVDIISAPWNDFLEGLEAREYPAYMLSWLADYPDPQNFVGALFASGSPENHTNYANPAVDALLQQAAGEVDQERRADLYRQAQRIILDDAVVLPLYFATDYTVIKPHVKGLVVTPMGLMGLERAWIER